MSENWSHGPLIGFDTETTGVDPETARIVSAAVVLHDPVNRRRWEREWLINPGIEIPLEVTAVHGISTETAVENGLSPADGITRILKAFQMIQAHYGKIPVVIFNAPYDLTILDRELGRHLDSELNVDFPVIDPLVCDRVLDKYRSGRRTLTAVSAAYGVGIAGAHTATGDVLCSVRLARAMSVRFPQFANASLDVLQVWQQSGYKAWAEHFTEYRRASNPVCEPIASTWPLITRMDDSGGNVAA